MFERSLYDLIRGLRSHKGNEREFIQGCLKECRAEVRSQDMDLKATALLKLMYLEMVGHDMSWAAFNVLEVMSSAKYHQKRVGYLAAIQSIRPDTEVLMLATNLLKKDLTASMPTIISLPITALPHIITPSLALSVLADLLPRLSHSNPAIRKKTIVTLYRMALVYPETLRAAWPKIKDRLMDNDEDPSVTAAIVNVICELGWRRPNDFLPLAPRLFELLVDSSNNWMGIKLIKLFATLTPLEPRLVRKLLPPLTNLIRTTPAMSLLYECINGIIQGGILGDSDDASGREEIATLCVTKLRGMIMIGGDANLKYVALLAFNKIVVTHPALVAQQEDVILECIDSEDITIRIKALDLVQGMVSSDNLVSIVSRLMRQLKSSSAASAIQIVRHDELEQPFSDDDEEGDTGRRKPSGAEKQAPPPLPDDFVNDVIGRILSMCSQKNYGSLLDFDWYIDVLTQLIRIAPTPRPSDVDLDTDLSTLRSTSTGISEKIGDELRNVAVKVKVVRSAAVRAADAILQQLSTDTPSATRVADGSLKPISWMVAEYATHLSLPEDTLGFLLQLIPRTDDYETLAVCLQAVIKILSFITGDDQTAWSFERKSKTSLLMARVIHMLESLTSHPYLEVQERAVEFTELLKLTAEAVSGQAAATDDIHQDPPLLLTQAIPSLFNSLDLNSVAPGAQKNVPIPDGLDLDQPIHPNLDKLLAAADSLALPASEDDEFESYYKQRPAPTSIANEPAINRLADAPEEVTGSYQQAAEESYLDPDIVARRKAERQERNRDDPFYIQAPNSTQRASTPIHNILQHENGPDLDIDSIPIMQLDLEKLNAGLHPSSAAQHPAAAPKQRQKVQIATDETIGSSGTTTPQSGTASDKLRSSRLKQSLLKVDSSNIGSLSLEGSGGDFERRQREDAEMAQAVKEVERLRLEMQRANERIQVAQGVPDEGTVIKKKKRPKKVAAVEGEGVGEDGDGVLKKVKKKKKKPVAAADGDSASAAGEPAAADGAIEDVAKPRKKKVKKIVQLDDEEPEKASEM